MSYALSVPGWRRVRGPVLDVAVAPLKFLQLFVSLPALTFIFALLAMLFRPPDLKSFPIDRLGFLALASWPCVHLCLRRARPQTYSVTWPLLGLLVLGMWGAIAQPYDPQNWSTFAAKWAVPFLFFHVSGAVFCDEKSLAQLEVFLLVVLVYLSAISIFSLLNATDLIFPRYIFDESIGIHADRARGPFLQAVANGVCLNLLGLIALYSFRRRKLPRIISGYLLVAVPLALLATKTRAVWISATLSVALLAFFPHERKVRRAAVALCAIAVIFAVAVFVCSGEADPFSARLMDRSPVDFRSEMYQAGWQMFAEKPLLGWGSDNEIQPEIEKRVSNFRPEYYVFHNTFLELGVQRGVLGVGLYGWLMLCLFRLRKCDSKSEEDGPAFTGVDFRKLWPLLLAVYLLNACAVVMNYEFVNALIFMLAGILAGHGHRIATQRPVQHSYATA